MKKYIYIILPFLLSCKQEKNIQAESFDLKKNDKIYERLSKLPDNQLTKIDMPTFIDLDTIEGDNKTINIDIKNVGKNKLNFLHIKPPCSCNTISKYDSIILPTNSQSISINMKFDKVGNFYQGITVYGSFFPYIKKIYVQGYRRE